MKYIARKALSHRTLRFLRQRTERIANSLNLHEEAQRLWRWQKNIAFREIRRVLHGMAQARRRCMYCEDSQGTGIDHFWPKSKYPAKTFEWENLLLSCSYCNNKKSALFPLDQNGQPLLIDPTREDPARHLLLAPTTGRLRARRLAGGLSPKGETSIQVYELNRSVLNHGRRDTWIVLEHLIIRYSQVRRSGKHEQAREIESVLRHLDFASIFVSFLALAAGKRSRLLITSECLQVLEEFPEIQRWI